MKTSTLIISLTCALAVNLAGCSSKQVTTQFQMGKTAFQQGEYRDAFADLMPAANKGNPEAQYAVGYMYFYGKGTEQNTLQAKQWFTKAAKQNYPEAKEALTMLDQQAQQENNPFSAPANQLMDGGDTQSSNNTSTAPTPSTR